MIWLLVALVVIFALFAMTFRRGLMHWMKVGYKAERAATDLLEAETLRQEERQKLRDRFGKQMTNGT